MTALIVFVSEIAKPELSAARLAKRSSNSGPSYNRGNYISCRILRISTDFSDFQIFRPGSGRRLGFAFRQRRAQAIFAARGQADAAPLDRAPARHAGSGDRLRGARSGGPGVSQARLERLRRPLAPLYCGGASRRDSVLNGIIAAASLVDPNDWILVHD